jgi:hypothetical protein
MALDNLLKMIVTSTDANGIDTITKRMRAENTTAANVELASATLADTNAHSQTLPKSPALQVLVLNTHATAKLTVTWTPQGGASCIAAVLGPGDVLVLWATATSGSAGITALSLQSDTSGQTFDMFLGG